MNSRQDRILKVSMSIAVGTMAFCLTVPAVLVLGGIVFGYLGWLDGAGLVPTGFAILFLISLLIGLIVGIFAAIKYYQHIEKRADT
jgi:hypothetical protein